MSFDIELNPNFLISIDIEFEDLLITQKNTPLSEIRNTLLSEIFETPTDKIITDSVFLSNLFFGIDIKTDSIDTYLGEDYIMTYEKTVDGKAEFVNDRILSYGIYNYIYSGGAHGYGKTTHLIFDLKTGKKLSEEDIFEGDYENFITKIIWEKLAAEYELPLDVYCAEEVKPNHNFSVTEKGVCYCFNSYEIAAYSYGNFYIFISYEELKPVLKKESVIEDLY